MVVPDVEEGREGEPEQVVIENARRKARAGLERAGAAARVLGVDTDVLLDGRLLGKPASEADARQRLEALSGRTHEVLSGVVLLAAVDASPHSGKKLTVAAEMQERVGVARSRVTFRELGDELMQLYLRSGEWRDRAGAYAIQGLGSVLVERVEGDVSNVVGLPVRLLLELAPELFDPAGRSRGEGPDSPNR